MTPSTLLTVRLSSEHDVVAARQRARQIAGALGFSERAQTRLATAISEIARNATQYAGGGRVTYHLAPDERCLILEVVDQGDGIDDLDSILAGDYRSTTGLGLGLRGARELCDLFEVDTGEHGTRIRLSLDLPANAPQIDAGWLRALSDRLAQDQPESAYSEVIQQNRELVRAFSELEARQEETDELNRQLQEAADAKDRFMAMLGHELRNMLGALRTAIEVLHRAGDDAPQEKMRWIARRQVDHLTRLVDDLLDASKVAAGKLDLHLRPVDLADEIRGELEGWYDEMSSVGIMLETEVCDEPLPVVADPARLAQILGNLLTNAKKFTDAGGRVAVSLRRDDGRARVTVRDTGCGFAPDAIDHILEPFAQGDAARKRMTGGLGLGLSVVQALLEAQGGGLQGSSPGQGEGATFTFDLPLDPGPHTSSVETSMEEPVETWVEDRAGDGPLVSPLHELPVETSHERADGASDDRASDLRILLIDDHVSSVEGLAELLRFDGYHVEIALDGPEGLETARRLTPQVIICDLGLPGMDGYEVVRRLRRTPETAAARIYALSGYGDSNSVDEAMAAGFDAHLVKPVDFDRLETLLAESSN